MKAGPLIQVEAMFVQTATGVEGGSGKLTLRGLAPSTLYFSDRPQRVVGHVSSRQFVDLWALGENSFAEDPPNAVLAFVHLDDERLDDVVMMLRDPRLDGDGITYTVDVLEGSLPSRAGPCSLFIDPLGRPLSPVSVMGVHRRARRRARRGPM